MLHSQLVSWLPVKLQLVSGLVDDLQFLSGCLGSVTSSSLLFPQSQFLLSQLLCVSVCTFKLLGSSWSELHFHFFNRNLKENCGATRKLKWLTASTPSPSPLSGTICNNEQPTQCSNHRSGVDHQR